MEIARIQLARAIWLFDTADLNPHGAQVFPDIVLKVIERYSFRKFPKAEEFFEPGKARRFEDGSFLYDGRKIGVTCELWGDGIIADTQHSTDASDAFIADLIEWLGQQLGVKYPPQMTRKRAYRSELVVYAGRSLSGLCERLELASELIKAASGESAELSGITYSSDQKRGLFTFERRIGEPFESNKFFSAVMLGTVPHIQILDGLSRIFERE